MARHVPDAVGGVLVEDSCADVSFQTQFPGLVLQAGSSLACRLFLLLVMLSENGPRGHDVRSMTQKIVNTA